MNSEEFAKKLLEDWHMADFTPLTEQLARDYLELLSKNRLWGSDYFVKEVLVDCAGNKDWGPQLGPQVVQLCKDYLALMEGNWKEKHRVLDKCFERLRETLESPSGVYIVDHARGVMAELRAMRAEVDRLREVERQWEYGEVPMGLVNALGGLDHVISHAGVENVSPFIDEGLTFCYLRWPKGKK